MKPIHLATVFAALALTAAVPAAATDATGASAIQAGTQGAPPSSPPAMGAPASRAPGGMATERAERTPRSGDFNAQGDVSGSALIGAKVKNTANETVGKVEEVYVGMDGQVKNVVVSVGGFLGMGKHDVAMPFNELKLARDKNDLIVTTQATKESLKAMPEYKK